MELIKISYETLKRIIVEEEDFSKALKETFNLPSVHSDKKSDISSLVGCSLRHYLVFSFALKNNFKEINKDVVLIISLLLSNKLFLHRFLEEDLLEEASSLILEIDPEFNINSLKEFMEHIGEDIKLIPDTLDKSSSKYLSLRFNTPEWVIRLWIKHFGRTLTYKILKANTKMASQSLVINPLKSNFEEIKEMDQDFKAGLSSDTFVYTGRRTLRKLEVVTSKKAFIEKMALKSISDNVEIDPFRRIAIYQEEYTPLYINLALKVGGTLKGDLITPPNKDVFKIKNEIKAFALNGYSVYESTSDSFLSIISDNVSNFFVLPFSSNFDKFRSMPDYFLKVKPETLDKVIVKQKQALREASKYIEEGGAIIYIVPTIDKKEGQLLIRDFLKENEEFNLEREKQYFPFDKFEDSLYFAVIRKRISSND